MANKDGSSRMMPDVATLRVSQKQGSQGRGLPENRTKLNEAHGHEIELLEDGPPLVEKLTGADMNRLHRNDAFADKPEVVVLDDSEGTPAQFGRGNAEAHGSRGTPEGLDGSEGDGNLNGGNVGPAYPGIKRGNR